MKPHIIRMTWAILGALSMLPTGCSDHRATEEAIVTPKLDLKDLEAKIGMTLPSDAVLLDSSDGGGRDPSYGFYTWTVFSPSRIKMPLRQAPGVKDYLDLPLADSVKYVEVKTHRRKILQPKSALSSDWQNSTYTFDGTVIRSSEGDYLVVERFRKK